MSPRMARNERTQLAMKKTMATEVSSSMNVFCETFKSLRDVRTMKHKPKRFEDAFKTCGDLSFLLSMPRDLNSKGGVI